MPERDVTADSSPPWMTFAAADRRAGELAAVAHVARLDRDYLRQIEQKAATGADMTPREQDDFIALVIAGNEKKPDGIIGEVDEGQELTADQQAIEQEWDDWYSTPLVELVRPRPVSVVAARTRRLGGRRAASRRKHGRSRRARAPDRPRSSDRPVAGGHPCRQADASRRKDCR